MNRSTLGWYPLQQRRAKLKAILLYKIMNNLAVSDKQNIISTNSPYRPFCFWSLAPTGTNTSLLFLPFNYSQVPNKHGATLVFPIIFYPPTMLIWDSHVYYNFINHTKLTTKKLWPSSINQAFPSRDKELTIPFQLTPFKWLIIFDK